MKGFLIDTHIWIWFVSGNTEIKKNIQKTITRALHDNNVYLAAISLWEICMLEKRQRIRLEMPCLEWINRFLELTHIIILPLTPKIAHESGYLPGNFHGDPADRLIAATARIHDLTIVTRDKSILTYGNDKYVSCLKA